jgi:hypothetical protein
LIGEQEEGFAQGQYIIIYMLQVVLLYASDVGFEFCAQFFAVCFLFCLEFFYFPEEFCPEGVDGSIEVVFRGQSGFFDKLLYDAFTEDDDHKNADEEDALQKGSHALRR